LKVKDQGHKVIQLQGSDVHLERFVTGGHGWPMQILRSEAEIKRTDYFSVWYRSWRLLSTVRLTTPCMKREFEQNITTSHQPQQLVVDNIHQTHAEVW